MFLVEASESVLRCMTLSTIHDTMMVLMHALYLICT